MAIIDSAGLFLGDRLGWCSDTAQLHWPRLYSAANNFARLELNYRKIASKAYANFRKPPTEQEFWAMVREYKDNFLLLVYQTDDGVLWGQWQTNERYLLGHKNAEDRRSPVPPLDAQDAYRNAYLERKKGKSSTNVSLADLLEVVPSCPESCDLPGLGVAGVGVGVGGGEGVGGGKKPSPPKAERESLPKKTPDPRHDPFRKELARYYKLQANMAMTWSVSEAKQLSDFLAANPLLTFEDFETILDHRARSDVTHTERPRIWLPNATAYLNSPLDRFNKPLGGKPNAKAGREEHVVGVAQRYEEKIIRETMAQPTLSSGRVDEAESAVGRICP